MSSKAVQGVEWYAGIPRATRRYTLFGFSLMAVSLLGFGSWAATALIAGAIVAAGSFVATGENKIIQHFEGGVIKEIKVREGDIVEQGDVLIRLDETTPKAELRRLVLREDGAMAMQARLNAEMAEHDIIDFPKALMEQSDDPDVSEILDRERQALKARRDALKTEIASLKEGIDALNERVRGGIVQRENVQKQLGFFEEELKAKKALYARGLIRKPDVLALERARANMNGEIGRLTGEVGDARQRIARIREQITGVRNTAVKTILEQLHEVSAELKDVRERIRAAQAVVERINITAPVKGIVIRLRYHTPGGVIEAGKPIMDLLPLQDELVIEAHVKPRDIDSVKQGQHAMVRLTALNRRITPMIGGEVVYISADSLGEDSRRADRPTDIYVARVRLNPMEVAQIHGFVPTPGMPVEVYIKTTDRTFLDYVVKPLKDSMARAFREP